MCIEFCVAHPALLAKSGFARKPQPPETQKSHLLAAAVDAMREIRPKAEVRKKIHAIYDDAKDEWCEYLLRRLLADPEHAAVIRSRPIARRLAHILPSST